MIVLLSLGCSGDGQPVEEEEPAGDDGGEVELDGGVGDAICGDGVLAGDERCEEGPCCTEGCELAPAGTACRASTSACDPAEACSGESPECPADVVECPVDHVVKAFPTAEGFGAEALGGRGGRVIEVTNLDDAGAGSLRDCAEATGPRTCVFRVAGTITLASPITIAGPERSYLTIAGQTAPGDGVQLRNWGLSIAYGVHDVVIRFLRVRQGADASPENINNDCGGIIFYGPGSDATTTSDLIVDHVSIAWACDDSFQFYGGMVRDATIQWSLIGEGLTGSDYTNSQGEPANPKGILVAGSNANWTVHHNLLIHSESRNPYAKGGVDAPATLDYRNNLGYNWRGCQGNCSLGEYNEYAVPGNDASLLANFVGNEYIGGPNSNTTDCALGTIMGLQTQLYVEDNRSPFCEAGCTSLEDLGFVDGIDYVTPAADEKFRTFDPIEAPPVTMTSIDDLESVLSERAGATVPVRDALDARLVDELRTRTGETGRGDAPWPELADGLAPADQDHDGMPDEWESARGLDPSEAADGAEVSGNGYTNVENYLNELAGDPVP